VSLLSTLSVAGVTTLNDNLIINNNTLYVSGGSFNSGLKYKSIGGLEGISIFGQEKGVLATKFGIVESTSLQWDVTGVSIPVGSSSSSTTSGALQVTGGVGITQNINVGGTAKITGALTILNTTDSLSLGTGSIITSGGISMAKHLQCGGTAYFADGLYVDGTQGFRGTSTFSSYAEFQSTLSCSQTATFSSMINANGGINMANNNLYLRDNGDLNHRLFHDSTTDSVILMGWQGGNLQCSNSTSTGIALTWNTEKVTIPYELDASFNGTDGTASLSVMGGLFVDKETIIRSVLTILDTRESWLGRGAFVCNGGASIGGQLHVGLGLETYSGITLNQQKIFFAAAGDNNHYIEYNSTLDGVKLQGYAGGGLYSAQNTSPALTWNATGVAITGDLTVGGYITSGALFPTSISSSASIRAGTTLSVAGTSSFENKITGANGFNFHNTRIGTIQYDTANFYTFPENGVYLFLISVGGTTSNTISVSDNLTKVYFIAVCDSYAAQVGTCTINPNSGFFNVTNGTTYKSISFTTSSNGYIYNYFYQKLF
jgi:hypothetical protein